MHVVIIGNGIAGFSAAKKLRELSGAKITLISGESAFPFSRTSLMYQFMGQVRMEDTLLANSSFWKQANIERIQEWVKDIHTNEKSIILASGHKIEYDKLLLATGSDPSRPAWWQREISGVTGFYHLSDVERIEQQVTSNLQRAYIVGGGLIGIEVAEMLQSRNIAVTMLVREASYMAHLLPEAESRIISDHITSMGVQVIYNEEITGLEEERGELTYIHCAQSGTVPCSFLCVATGVTPSVSLAQKAGIAIGKGIFVNEHMETSAPDIYAAGDCAEQIVPFPGRPSVEAMWYSSRAMGEHAAMEMVQKTAGYTPGVWYNSAAFFSLVMQMYGRIQSQNEEGTADMFWQHPVQRQTMRIRYHKKSMAVQGFLSLGIRLRHRQCDHWITSNTPVADVLLSFNEALIQPEFSGIDYHNVITCLHNELKTNQP